MFYLWYGPEQPRPTDLALLQDEKIRQAHAKETFWADVANPNVVEPPVRRIRRLQAALIMATPVCRITTGLVAVDGVLALAEGDVARGVTTLGASLAPAAAWLGVHATRGFLTTHGANEELAHVPEPQDWPLN